MKSRLAGGIFLFSSAALSFEIVLTRIFTISLWYHFAYMIISIAMLGISASGTVLSLYTKLRTPRYLGLYGLLLGSGITLSYCISNQIPFDPMRISWDPFQLLYVCLYYIALSLPFFFFGLSIATALSSQSGSSGLFYGADLLGAGIGSLGLLLILQIVRPEVSVIVSSLIALTGAFIITDSIRIKAVAALLAIANVILVLLPGTLTPRMSPYKGLQLALYYPGAEHLQTYQDPFARIDVFRSPAVRFAPGLSLTYLDELPEQMGLSIDGGEVTAITTGTDNSLLRFLSFLPAALPYELGKRKDVLVLEPRGGLAVLLARHYGAEKIYKVDSNPLALRVTNNVGTGVSQGIYDEDSWAGMGRTWLEQRDILLDLIDIPITGTAPSGHFGIAEDYKLTREALSEYLKHLKPDGILSIQTFILPPPRTEFRILTTLVDSLEGMGVRQSSQNIIAIRSWGSVCILAKREPFTHQEVARVRKFATKQRFDLIHLPGIREEESNIYVRLASDDYFRAFRSILNPSTRIPFQDEYIFDIRPVQDESPFFHYHLRLKHIRETFAVMGGKWQYFIEEGYLLPIVFVQALLLSVIILILPVVLPAARKDNSRQRTPLIRLVYFALLGIGFMFVEITLIQKMILPLENASYAVAVVLASILISSGTGGLLSNRIAALRRRSILLMITTAIVISGIAISFFAPAIMSCSLPLRVAILFIALFPMGFFMGIPFPLGIIRLGETSPHAIPLAWAVNGCLSVLAPVVTIMLAMAIGFSPLLWLGAGAYLIAFAVFPSLSKNS